MLVHKLNPRGEVIISYEAALAERLPDGVRLDALWTRPPLELGYTTFETGDRFVEWFYTDRWYNVFEIQSGAGRLKGWYCNVAAPARITDDEVACRDLLLDLWVSPDGATLVLDEDEFAAADIEESERVRALAALDELRGLVAQGAPPFEGRPYSSPPSLGRNRH